MHDSVYGGREGCREAGREGENEEGRKGGCQAPGHQKRRIFEISTVL